MDFELGEDVRDESRLRQDEAWSGAVADGRGHVSHRELTLVYAPQLNVAINDFRLVGMLVDAMHDPRNILYKLNTDTLRIIIDYAIPGLGPLVTASIAKRELASSIAAARDSNRHYPFRICVRKRPMLHFEEEQGMYDVCR